MSNLALFQKQGGMKLIRQYARTGVLNTAIGEYLLLGRSRTALELLRLSTQLKTTQKLKKRYSRLLNDFDALYDDSLPHEASKKVWVCWFQGIENAPHLVKRCYRSLNENLCDREIVLITAENMSDYVHFPQFILEKWEKGVITHTHLTDLLRLELLTRYGGLWIDATVLCTSPENAIPKYFFDSELFLFQCLKPGRDGHSHINSSWLISAKTNNRILQATKYLCYEYWKTHNSMIDYFLLHEMMAIVSEHYPDEWNAVVPRDNAAPHILLLRLFDPYDERIWNAIKEQTPFHKLSYKFQDEKTQIEGTNYKRLIE